MRVISQNGSIDLPYENVGVGLSRLNEGGIVAYPLHMTSDSEIMTMAKYSSEDKARKALDMLHEAYCGSIGVSEKREEYPEGVTEFIDTFFPNIKRNEYECFVWRFPQEDEI